MAGAYTITIKAIDKASGTFDTANKAVERLNKQIALARAPFDQLHANFQKFAKITGLGKIATGFQDVAKGATECFRSMLRVIEPLAAITGAASAAGLYRLAQGWASFETQLGNSALRAGQTANSLQSLQGAAKMAGVDAGTLTAGMTTLNDNMRNAAFGGASQFISTLTVLGLSYDDIKKKSPNEVLGILADKLAGIKNPTDRAIAGANLFGGAIDGMTPFLLKGKDGIQALIDRANGLSRSLGEQGVKDAQAFTEAQAALAIATENVANALGSKLGVALTPLLNQFADFIGKSPEVTAALDAVGRAAKQFADWLAGVDWAGVSAGVLNFATEAGHLATEFAHVLQWMDRMGLVGPALGIALGAKLLVPLLSIGKALGVLGAFSPPAWMLAALGVGGILAEKNRQDVFARASGNDPSAIASGLTGEYIPPATAPMRSGGFGLMGEYFKHLFGGGGDSGGTASIPPGMARDNAKAMADVFKKHGLTQEGSAAMLASAMGESGDNPDPAHNNEGRGIFQDSPSRQAAIAAHMGKPFAQLTAAEQAEGAIWEIDTKPEFAGLKTSLRSSHDLAAQNAAVVGRFEAPADIPGQTDKRMPMARGALKQLQLDEQNAGGTPSGVVATPPSGAPVSAPAAPIGQAGANGRVDMNVKVAGAAQVTTTSTGDIGVKVETRNVAKDGY